MGKFGMFPCVLPFQARPVLQAGGVILQELSMEMPAKRVCLEIYKVTLNIKNRFLPLFSFLLPGLDNCSCFPHFFHVCF